MSRHGISFASAGFFLALVAVSFLAWRFLEGNETRWRRATTAVAADLMAARIESYFQDRLGALAYLRDAMPMRQDEFEAQARSILKMLPGIQALNWIDGDQVIRWVTPPEIAESVVNRDLGKHPEAEPALALAAREGGFRATRPTRLLRGVPGIAVYVRVDPDDPAAGYLGSAFRIDTMASQVLEAGIADSYAIVILDRGMTVFAEGATDSTRFMERKVRVADRTWSLRLSPAMDIPQTNTYLLLIGIVFSAALALLLRLVLFRRSEIARQNATLRRLSAEQTLTLDSARMAILFVKDRKVIRFNRRTQEMLGRSEAELQGLPTKELYEDESAYESIRREAHPALTSGQPFETEVRLRRGDGSVFWARLVGNAVDPADESEGFVWLAEDITARKEADRGRRQSEKNYKTLFDSSPDGIALTAPDGPIEDVNASLLAMLGYGEGDLRGRRFHEITPLKWHEFVQEQIGRMRATGQPVNFEIELIHKNGSTIPVEVHLWPASSDGAERIMGRFVDLRERRRVEELTENLGRIMENMTEEVNIFDAETLKFVQVNRGGRENLGYSMEELWQLTPVDIGGIGGFEQMEELLRPLRDGETDQLRHVGLNRRKDGSVYDVEVRIETSTFEGRPVFVAVIRDVSERKRAEDELRRQATIIDQVHGSVVVSDLEGRIISWSQGSERLYGYRADEVMGQSIAFLYPQGAAALIEKRYQELLRTGTVEEEGIRVRKSGEEFWCRLSLTLLRDEDGEPTWIVGYGTDITERREIEKALRDSETRFRNAFESTGLGTAIIDASGGFLRANRAICDMLGYSEEELLAMNMGEITAPEYREESYLQIKKLTDGEIAEVDMEKQYLRKDGSTFWGQATSSMTQDVEGFGKVTIAHVRDISERKRTEEQLRRHAEIIRQIRDPVVTTDKNRRITSWNDGAEKLFGYTAEEVIGRYIGFVYADAEQVPKDTEISEPHREGKSLELEIPMKKKSGEIFQAWLFISLLHDRDGNPTGNVGYVRDITEKKQADQAIRESEQKYRSLFDTSRDGIVFMGLENNAEEANQAYLDLMGYTLAELSGLDMRNLIPEHMRSIHDTAMASQVNVRGYSDEYEISFIRKDGTVFPAVTRVWVVCDAEGKPERYMRVVRDIAEQKRAEDELRKLSRAVEQSPASVVITDTSGKIEYVNSRFVQATGYSREEVMGKTPAFLKSGHTSLEEYRQLWQTITSGGEWRGEFHNKKKNGELFWEFSSISPIMADDGTISHFLEVKEDITVRKEYEEKLLRQANYDDLTGLPNRILALDRLGQVLATGQREGLTAAVMYIDLDRFKNVNDTLGHAAGDRVIQEAAERLKKCVRASDTVARLGGDEFLVILPDLPNPIASEVAALKILDAFSRPFRLEGQEVFVTASIGLTIFPDDGTDAQQLLRNGDAAMYQAKDKGRNIHQFFTPELNVQAVKRMELETQLRRALARKEFRLDYQPILDASSGRIVGVEGLLRWDNPELGLIMPDQLIPVAEETGLIVAIGEWVLLTACLQVKAWHDLGHADLIAAVNVSPRQFRSGDLVDTVSQVLDESGLPAHCLALEITENLLLDIAPETTTALHELNDMGVRLYIDDFGTGYSALSYIKNYPFHSIKIDRAFVAGVTTDPEDAALVRAMIAMAHSLGLKVTGEGVETTEQFEFLKAEGCDLVQGYYFAKPSAAADFEQLLSLGSAARKQPN